MLQFAVVTTGMVYLFLFTHRELRRPLGEAAASGYLQLVQLSRTFSVFYENRKKRNASGCWSRTQHRKAFRETIIVCFNSDAEQERLVYSRRKALVPGELTSRFCLLAAEPQSISYVFCVFSSWFTALSSLNCSSLPLFRWRQWHGPCPARRLTGRSETRGEAA